MSTKHLPSSRGKVHQKHFSVKRSFTQRLLNRAALCSAVFFGAFVVTMGAASVFTPQQGSYADRIVAINDPSGYTLTVSSAGSVTMQASSTATGTYVSGKDTVNIKTNAPGYLLYLSMNNDDTDGNRLYKDGVSTATNYISPTSGTWAVPAELLNDSWGYAVTGAGSFDASYDTPTPNPGSKWAAMPLRGSAQLIKTATAANADPGDNVDVYYGVKATTALPAGVYSNTISYTAVLNSGAINDIATISPERTNQLAGGQTVTISTNLSAAASGTGTITVTIGGQTCANPTASNSGAGNVLITCTTPQMSTGTYDVVATIADYGKTYYIPDGIEYYQDYVPTLADITYMHEMTSEVCARTTTPMSSATSVPEKSLIDVRGKDGTGTIENPATGTNQQTYLVRKLADGNCWMAQNLNLNLSTAVSLNNTTTDLNSKTFWTPAVSTQTAVGTTWAQDGADGIHSFEPGDIYFPNGVGTGTADTYGNLTGATSGAAYWHIGNYYNWPAATAASGTATMVAPDTAPDSICPKGWKLPDNEGTKSFVNLVFTTYGLQDNDATSSTKLLAAPLNFVRSGHYYWSNGQVYYKGAGGDWWSTAAYSTATYAQHLTTNSTRVIPQTASYKGYGLTVRCVAR